VSVNRSHSLDESFSGPVAAPAWVTQVCAAAVRFLRMQFSGRSAFDRIVQSGDESDAYLRCPGWIDASEFYRSGGRGRKLREATRSTRLCPGKV